MKYLTSLLLIFSFFMGMATLAAASNYNTTDSTGLPGDHFSLEGALELFKQADSPEAFEKALNTEKNYVNNLDLNGDGDIDYIRVIDHAEGDVHALVLQVPVSAGEAQDIAVIETEKTGPESAILQIIGDEDIYGESLIVEPFEEESTGRGGKGGAQMDDYVRVVVNVYGWRSVRFIYAPGYVVWRSPFYWGYYPNWWRPWRHRPFRWFSTKRFWYPRTYHVVRTHRVVKAHRVYVPKRTKSVTVKTRYTSSVTRYKANKKVTRTTRSASISKGNKNVKVRNSKTSVQGKKGNKAIKGKKSTTTVRGKKGNKAVKGKKSTTKVKGKKGNKKAGAKKKTVKKKRKN